MQPEQPQNVKYFIGALYSDQDLYATARQRCEAVFGMTDIHSPAFPFDQTDYYNQEMGTPVFRRFFSFEPLTSPGKLADFKIICNSIEQQLAIGGQRKVNLDIGYLDLHKVVLASAKYNGQKIYLGQGIYADPTLIFERGRFQAAGHTFPDFKSDRYYTVFEEMRSTYKAQLRSQ